MDESASHIEGTKVMQFEDQRIEIEAGIGPLWFEHTEPSSAQYATLLRSRFRNPQIGLSLSTKRLTK